LQCCRIITPPISKINANGKCINAEANKYRQILGKVNTLTRKRQLIKVQTE